MLAKRNIIDSDLEKRPSKRIPPSELAHDPYLCESHMLAALACLLTKDGRRVVYLPDCRSMLRGPEWYLRSALLLAFADD